MSESFSTLPLQSQIYSYAYQQFADDENVQAFFAAYNTLAQSYLDWFNQTPLALYTSSSISGPLLDWVGQGLFGLERPVLSTLSSTVLAGYGTLPYGTDPYGTLSYSASGTATIASDDIYKRVLTWHTYKGDGLQFNLQWLKNRIARFLNGINGTDYPVLSVPPDITVVGATFTITLDGSIIAMQFAELLSNNELALPFMYNYTVVT
jgi:hypothetical protein